MAIRGGTVSQSKRMALANGAVLAFVALFVLAAYTVLHEGGHALLGLLFGGTITRFDVSFWDLTANVGLEGEFTAAEQALISVAGVGLPCLVWSAMLLASPREVSPLLSWLRTVGSLAVINSLLAWIVLPLLYLQGHALGDDSINFLRYTNAPPLLASAAALTVYLSAWALFFRRAGSPRALLTNLPREAAYMLAPASVSSLRGLLAVGVVGAALAGATSLYLARTNPLALPPGYSPAGTVDLSQRAYADEVVHRFTLEREATANLLFVLQNVTSGPMEIVMTGPAGYHAAFLRLPNSEEVIGRATVHPRDLRLPKGDYEIRFTFPRVPGKITIATKVVLAATVPTAATALPTGSAKSTGVRVALNALHIAAGALAAFVIFTLVR